MRNKRRSICAVVCLAALFILSGCGEKYRTFSAAEDQDAKDQSSKKSHAPLPSGHGGYAKTGTPYQIAGKWYYPLTSSKGYNETGIASWYGEKFHGKTTANGERYDMHKMSAAHNTLPMPSMVRVTNLDNKRSVIVRINDRGPFVKNRIIDLSYAAAKALAYDQQGTARVRVQSLDTHTVNSSINKQYTSQAVSSPAPRLVPKKHKQSSMTGAIYVQLGAFSSYANANQLHDILASDYPNVRIHHTTASPWYRVRIGPYDTIAESEAVILSLQQQGYAHAMMVIE